MYRVPWLLFWSALSVIAIDVPFAAAQATATASQRITPSLFAGMSGVYTGIGSGRNVSLTAGLDLAFLPGHRLRPALEYRGMIAVDKGRTASLKNNLGGLKLGTSFRRLQPYVDLLAGRGETTYANGGVQVPNTLIFYTHSSSNVYSLGGGADLLAAHQFALKLDFQMQRYSSPVTMTRHAYSEVGTLGIVYILHRGLKARR